jgi:hypothetical protein
MDELVNVYYIYIDKTKELVKYKKEIIILTKQNTISREELIHILKKNNFIDNIKYSVMSILKFNYGMDYNNYILDAPNSFFTTIKHIDNIFFENNEKIVYKDLNDLYIFYYENPNINRNNNNTNNINNTKNNNKNNNTKKILFHPTSKHKKTIKKIV